MKECFPEIKKVCFLCGSNEWIVHLRIGDYIIIKCRGCGLGHTFPTPGDEQYIEINREIYTIPQRKALYKAHWKDLINRYNSFIGQIEEFQPRPNLKLLDVGCSLGYFLDAARNRGIIPYGVEVSKETSQFAREHLGLDVFCGTLEAAQFPNKTFDVITLWDVIEHVPDPINLLKEVGRILKDEGIIALQSPNMESVMAQMTGKYWSWWTVPDHLFHFTFNSMTRILKRCDFDIIYDYTWDPPKDFIGNLISASLQLQFSKMRLRERVLGSIIRITSEIAWPIVVPFQKLIWKYQRGGLIVAYARKKKK